MTLKLKHQQYSLHLTEQPHPLSQISLDMKHQLRKHEVTGQAAVTVMVHGKTLTLSTPTPLHKHCAPADFPPSASRLYPACLLQLVGEYEVPKCIGALIHFRHPRLPNKLVAWIAFVLNSSQGPRLYRPDPDGVGTLALALNLAMPPMWGLLYISDLC